MRRLVLLATASTLTGIAPLAAAPLAPTQPAVAQQSRTLLFAQNDTAKEEEKVLEKLEEQQPATEPETEAAPAEQAEEQQPAAEPESEAAPAEQAEEEQQPAAEPEAETAPAEQAEEQQPATEPEADAAPTEQAEERQQPVPTPEARPEESELAGQERDRRRREERVRIDEPIEPIESERGERIEDGRDVATRPRWRERRDAREVREFDDRVVIRLGDGGLVVERRDGRDERIRRRSRNVEVERLRGGRIRETVHRRNVSIVTIYGRNGEILRRSRIGPDGRETVLFYVPRDRWDNMPIGRERWDRDYGLPPLRVTVPRDRYVWEPRRASPEDYYEFLEQPPVERAERLYSVDEVRYSERLRDKLPRIDLETVNFAFGSARIREEDIGKLQDLADAIKRIVGNNPSESFLIEGHTDAVGSEVANLALSDRRAENVAIALTDVFDVPPENLVTQGYGESDLKVETEGRSAANRRVTVRRITPLVAPGNSARAQ
ncbi:MAG: OmpA family protein [Notoacmeibacter sp.]|nr:OmpA family protein [Notoacmeibacter sp.]